MLRRRMLFELPALSASEWTDLLAGEDWAATHALYAPLLHSRRAGRGFVLGRAAQSLDGYIATATGASRWIGGPGDILHTHRLRALCDAVVVGAGTIEADDPLLTTRRCAGPSPVRVVIDPRRRLSPAHRVFASGPQTLLLTCESRAGPCGQADICALPGTEDGSLDPSDILAALAARGLSRLLIEGGGHTVSRFLRAGALDRLHVTVAPLLLGHGIPAFVVPPSPTPQDGMRLSATAYAIGADVLFDITFAR